MSISEETGAAENSNFLSLLINTAGELWAQRRYGCRAMMLETVAAVPGMVGGMLLHLRSLRAQRRLDPGSAGGGRERAHEPHDLHGGGQARVVRVRARPIRAGRLLQRILPRLPHLPQVCAPRRGIPRGGGHPLLHRVPQGHRGRQDRERAAPSIAIDYWRLSPDATLKDVVTMVRADEAHHRDVNHYASVCRCTVSPV
jgi:ubiquinol oxidase